MNTVYATHASFSEHGIPGRQHPERPERIEAVWQSIQDAGLHEQLQQPAVSPADVSDILRAHDEKVVDTLRWISGQDRLVMIDQDTYALPRSYDIARTAAGAVITCVQQVCEKPDTNALAAIRPPGHHATPGKSMGFCLLNNVAIGARYAVEVMGLSRVMIVDFDVHHGNGTQDIFYEDADVLFLSTHQAPFYPGTGAIHETGSGNGKGKTINVPLPAGTGDRGFEQIYDRVVKPAAKRFAPDLIMVSAGFDAHHVDPLASLQLTLPGYAHITRQLIDMAKSLCEGRIVFVLEGGYDLQAVSSGMLNTAYALMGRDEVQDPLGPAPHSEPDIGALLDKITSSHRL